MIMICMESKQSILNIFTKNIMRQSNESELAHLGTCSFLSSKETKNIS